MDFLDTMYRYITGSNDGLLGKLCQHTGTFHVDASYVPEENVCAQTLVDRLDRTPVFYTRGSMAYIYKGRYAGTKIIIKVIPPTIKQSTHKQLTVLEHMKAIQFLNPTLADPLDEVQQGLRREMCMRNEYHNYKVLCTTNHARYGVSLVEPIDDLCDDAHFVYKYIKAQPLTSILSLDQSTINDCVARIIKWTLESSYRGAMVDIESTQIEHQRSTIREANLMQSIMIADINVGNFLYNHETHHIYAIDYGSIIQSPLLTEKCVEIYHECKTPEGIDALVDKYCGGSLFAKKQFETYRQIIHGKQILPEMGNVTQDINAMLLDMQSMKNIHGFEHIIAILRSQHMMLSLIKTFNVRADLGADFCNF